MEIVNIDILENFFREREESVWNLEEDLEIGGVVMFIC